MDIRSVVSILLFFRIFGFVPMDVRLDSKNVLQMNKNRSWSIYLGIVTIINVVNFVEASTRLKWDIKSFHGLVSHTRLMLVCFDSAICYIETMYNIQLQIEFFKTLSKVDWVLRKFNANVSCSRLKFWIPACLVLLVTINVIPQVMLMNFQSLNSIIITLQFEIPNFLASVKSLQIIFFAYLIDLRFNMLKKVQHSYGTTRSQQYPTFSDYNRYHSHMCSLIITFNKAFGWSILVNVTRDFIFFGEGWYMAIFRPLTSLQLWLLFVIWSHLVYVIILCVICQVIHEKAVQTCVIGLRIERYLAGDRKIQSTKRAFSLKVLHICPHFNAVGCFIIDLKLMYGFLAFIANYLLICVQFYFVE